MLQIKIFLCKTTRLGIQPFLIRAASARGQLARQGERQIRRHFLPLLVWSFGVVREHSHVLIPRTSGHLQSKRFRIILQFASRRAHANIGVTTLKRTHQYPFNSKLAKQKLNIDRGFVQTTQNRDGSGSLHMCVWLSTLFLLLSGFGAHAQPRGASKVHDDISSLGA